MVQSAAVPTLSTPLASLASPDINLRYDDPQMEDYVVGGGGGGGRGPPGSTLLTPPPPLVIPLALASTPERKGMRFGKDMYYPCISTL